MNISNGNINKKFQKFSRLLHHIIQAKKCFLLHIKNLDNPLTCLVSDFLTSLSLIESLKSLFTVIVSFHMIFIFKQKTNYLHSSNIIIEIIKY